MVNDGRKEIWLCLAPEKPRLDYTRFEFFTIGATMRQWWRFSSECLVDVSQTTDRDSITCQVCRIVVSTCGAMWLAYGLHTCTRYVYTYTKACRMHTHTHTYTSAVWHTRIHIFIEAMGSSDADGKNSGDSVYRCLSLSFSVFTLASCVSNSPFRRVGIGTFTLEGRRATRK